MSAPGEGTWIAKPRKPRWGPALLAGGGIIWQLPNILNLISNFSGYSAFSHAFTLGLVGLCAAILVREWMARRMGADDHALVDGAFGDQFPVEVTIVAEGRRVGTDRGVAWFGDGLMGFSGAASSFVLAASDLAPEAIKEKRHPMGKRPPSEAVVLLGAPKIAYIVVSPLQGHVKAYRYRFGKFMGMDERPLADRHWPPLEPYDASALPVSRTAEGMRP